ncbi:MAG: hypothetical protein KKA73_23930 [Chloroflexi bacterium]|nr:hypothetical protein [Chloroflexota bacterium]MBU1750741.1 hypothetical protein [Chloroflexota bacterium]MBU1877349.1 hypothetical protein [Chloroflexota bacterium]
MPTAFAHYTIRDLGDSLRIAIPSRKRDLVVLIVSLGTVVGVLAECMIALAFLLLVTDQPGIEDVGGLGMLLIAFAVVGVAMFGAGISVLMWELDGEETIDVDSHGFVIQRQAYDIRRQKKYQAEFITNLRSAPVGYRDPMTPDFMKTESVFFGRYGLIAFDYGRRGPQYFGSGVDAFEANQIVVAIEQKFPQYAAKF